MIASSSNSFVARGFRSPPSLATPSAQVEPAKASAEQEEKVKLSAAAEEPQSSHSGLKKLGLGMIAAVSLTSAVGGMVGYAAQNLPLCETEASWVAVQDGQVCVTGELSTAADGVYRTVRGQFHRGDAIQDLTSESNRVLHPESPRVDLGQDGELTVSTWNLHHGTSQNRDGARDQLGLQIDTINETNADIDLLQEILPWQAQELVDGTGKVGYYTQTTTRQGNLILVDPSLEVTENHRATLNHVIEDRGDAASVVHLTKGGEPRVAQLLKVKGEDTQGKDLTVFNTHLSTGSASPEARQRESEVFQTFVESQVGEDGVFVGGGDLNMGAGKGIVKSFTDAGYRVEGAKIDWLVSDNVSGVSLQAGDVRASDGTRISDHPLVVGTYLVKA